jgi:hypothetical protein
VTIPLNRALVFCGLLACVACGGAPERELQGQTKAPVGTTDFSGDWELDYSQSDNIQDELDEIVRELRKQQERRSQSGNMNRNSGYSVGGSGANSGASIMGLAQMAEIITESTLLEIAQDPNNIQIKRDGNFALACEYYDAEPRVTETPMGSEICGWSGHQMVFRIYLPEGLSIRHIFTLGPYRKRLNIATTVSSDRVSWPFTLDRVYNRYDPESGGIRCTQTLTKGKVCTTEAPKK